VGNNKSMVSKSLIKLLKIRRRTLNSSVNVVMDNFISIIVATMRYTKSLDKIHYGP